MAVNFFVSVSSLRGCLDACNNDVRCCHYSYHRSDTTHPDHENCYLFSSRMCDTEDLLYDEGPHHWRTGSRTRLSFRCPCHFHTISIIWPLILFLFILSSAWLIRNIMSTVHCTTLNFRSMGPQVTAAILIFILLQKSSSPLQSDRSSPLLSNFDIWHAWINHLCKSGLDPIDCKSSLNHLIQNGFWNMFFLWNGTPPEIWHT